jgi:hypothetical protein
VGRGIKIGFIQKINQFVHDRIGQKNPAQNRLFGFQVMGGYSLKKVGGSPFQTSAACS